ncbi:MAG: antitoxin family protein [Anaerolineae bacterium]|nr:antitoxin family protein [Anaerolineae bacterium]
MPEIITAVYERGALYPATPLNLREHQRVRVQILVEDVSALEDVSTLEGITESGETRLAAAEAVAEAGAGAETTEADKAKALIQRWTAEGRIYPRPAGPTPPDPVSAKERQALADRLGRAPGKLASEMVIEDRGEW